MLDRFNGIGSKSCTFVLKNAVQTFTGIYGLHAYFLSAKIEGV